MGQHVDIAESRAEQILAGERMRADRPVGAFDCAVLERLRPGGSQIFLARCFLEALDRCRVLLVEDLVEQFGGGTGSGGVPHAERVNFVVGKIADILAGDLDHRFAQFSQRQAGAQNGAMGRGREVEQGPPPRERLWRLPAFVPAERQCGKAGRNMFRMARVLRLSARPIGRPPYLTLLVRILISRPSSLLSRPQNWVGRLLAAAWVLRLRAALNLIVKRIGRAGPAG